MNVPICIWDAKALLGEGPHWVAGEDALYWIDIKGPAIHRYHPGTGKKSTWPMTEKIGCLVHKEGVGFMAALQSGFVQVDLGAPGSAPRITPLFNPEDALASNRFNDGKLDPYGRFIAGTMDDEETHKTGNWWVLEGKSSPWLLDADYQVTNGPAFDVARQRIYLTDSAAQTVFKADYGEDGVMTNKSVFLQFGDGDGYPDGMTTDQDGNLWIAFWDGACVIKFSPNGKQLLITPMPVLRPTSLCFDNTFETLFITSASIGLSKAQTEKYPLSGGLFKLDVTGL